jgi:hypothetical protein
VNFLCRHTKSPTIEHLRIIKYCLRYISGTTADGIVFDASSTPTPLQPIAFTDSNFAGDVGLKSTTGYLIQLAGGTIEAIAGTQSALASSINEAEVRAAVTATKACNWTGHGMKDFGHPLHSPIIIYADNKGQVDNSKELTQHKSSRHYRALKAFLYEQDNLKNVSFIKINTEPNTADIPNKPLSTKLFNYHKKNLMGDQSLFPTTRS